MKISNKYLSASFKSKGAELKSLTANNNNTEYIWQANPKHWGRHAPILFPIVGKLKNDLYQHDSKIYEMGQHGFARDQEFELLEHTSDSLTFQLKQSGETLKKYPFNFSLRITYRLESHAIFINYSVKNTGNETMPFSIGGHPAFNCPVEDKGKRSDYWLQFEIPENLITYRLVEGVFTGNTETIPAKKGRLDISDDLFDADALVFKGLKSDQVTLYGPEKKYLTFHFKGFPYLGIWSKSREAQFICIEPWYGLADHTNTNGDLASKEGIISLPGKQVFACTYSIEIH